MPASAGIIHGSCDPEDSDKRNALYDEFLNALSASEKKLFSM
jgi:hypothetical protein